jgi:hypothetical protein
MQDKLREFEETLSKTKAGTLKVLPPIRCVERVIKPKVWAPLQPLALVPFI